jgi:tRNA G18 (ribose-2'-O)-methylase SpoU
VPEFIRIDDADDPRIEGYRQVRERDLVGRQGGFMVEGEVVLRAWARSGRRHSLSSALIAETRAAALRPLLDTLPDEVVVYHAPPAVMDRIVGFPIHRGVLALGRRAPEPDPASLLAGLAPRALIVALFGISNHDNIGGIFRNAAAFGADAVLLDGACCDPLYRKAIRVSVGAALITPFVRLESGTDLLGLIAGCGFEAVALSPSGALPLTQLRRPERVALLLGAEGPGLPAQVLERARTVAIPMARNFDSLNVATACGVALNHLAHAEDPEGSPRTFA